jgi:hypothetical protein
VGINGGTDKDHAHAGLKHIFQQIVGPGDHIFALVLFDNIPSECMQLNTNFLVFSMFHFLC